MIRVTFGIMVLNGEPFTKYCLRSLHPFAYQIVRLWAGADAGRVRQERRPLRRQQVCGD